MQPADLLHPVKRRLSSLGDVCKFVAEHSGKAQHVIALALQGHAQPQLRDDEIEQRATLLEISESRPGLRIVEQKGVCLGRWNRASCTLRVCSKGSPMPRLILDDIQLHPAIQDKVANLNADIVHNVRSASVSNPVLVVGMSGNPFCGRARRALDAAGQPYHYLEYGGYLSQWRQRNSLKMWTGWPTFPMVFVKGSLVGGAEELKKLIDNGELKRLLGA